MTDKEDEKHVPNPFDEMRSKGPIIVCIGDLIKSRPNAKAKEEEPQPEPKPGKEDD